MSFCSQLKGVLRKNFLLHKQNKISTIAEFLLPIAFALLTMAILLGLNKMENKSIGRVNYGMTKAQPLWRNTNVMKACNKSMNGGIPCRIGFVPDDEKTKEFASRVLSAMTKSSSVFSNDNIQALFYNTLDSFRNATEISGSNFVAAIAFDKTTNNHTVLMNVSMLPMEYENPQSAVDASSLVVSNASLFSSSGWMSIENALDSVTLELLVPSSSNATNVFVDYVQSLPAPPPTALSLYPSILAALIAEMESYIAMPFLIITTVVLVIEKQSKMKEFLLILGLRKSVYWISWAITFSIPAAVAIAVSVLSLGIGLPPLSFGTWIRMICYFILFYISMTMFSFFLVSWIRSSFVAAAVAGITVFMVTNFFMIVPGSSSIVHFLCLVPPFTLCNCVFKDVAFSWHPLDPHFTDETSWSFLFLSFFLDIILYGFLAWYISEVYSSEYGISKPLYFLFTKEYWCSGKRLKRLKKSKYTKMTTLNGEALLRSSDEDDADRPSDLFEEQDFEEGEGIELRKIVKSFKSRGGVIQAVRGLSAQFCRGKITSLLGHNGAGKTTTINMMIGMYAPTSGDAFVDGLSIVENTDDIRQSLGVCPQDSLLYDDLSAPEHLMLVGRLKGYSDKQLKTLVPQALNNMGLPKTDHRDAPVKTFSGGMKRKLSLAIALFGNPKTVFLDEPTKGIDILSRRAIWDSLRSYKDNTTIILTTHSMEEADALSDYIYIMSNGSLCCGGTSVFLKQKLGEGYIVTFDISERVSCDTKAVLSIFQKHSPESEITNQSRTSFSISVPFKDSNVIGEILGEIEVHQEELKLRGYGVSLTTLEDVFIRASMNESDLVSGSSTQSFIAPQLEPKEPSTSTTTTTSTKEEKPESVTPVNKRKSALGDSVVELSLDEHPVRPSTVLQQFRAMFHYNWLYAHSNLVAMILFTFLPAVAGLVFLIIQLLSFSSMMGNTNTDLILHDIIHAKNVIDIPYVVSTRANTTALESLFEAANATARCIVFTEFESVNKLMNYSFTKGSVKGGLIINDVSFDVNAPLLNVTYLYNQTYYDSIVNYSNLMHNAFIRVMSKNSNFSVYAWSSCIPDETSESSGNSFSFGIAIGMIVFSSVIAQRFVRERVSMFFSQMMVAGLKLFVALITNFVSMTLYTLPATIIVLIVSLLPFGALEPFASSAFFGFMILMLLFNFNIAAFNMVFSRLFTSPANCTKWNIIIHLGAVIILSINRSVLNVLSFTHHTLLHTRDIINYITAPFVPALNMMHGTDAIMNMYPPYSLSAAYTYSDSDLKSSTFLSLGSLILYLAVATIVEILSMKLGKSTNESLRAPLQEDSDVTAERVRIERPDLGKSMQENTVVVRRARKVFQDGFIRKSAPVVAVNNVSFGVRENDCFGLLGPNGAGKSTLVNMITAEFGSTNGIVAVNNAVVEGWRNNIYPNLKLGRCPQNDALMEFLTPAQHIMLMACIRCDSTKRSIKTDVDKALRNLGLTSFADRPVKELSGGMRRKLSAALAMLPGTRLLVFDEPSTGLDPITRRSLWDAITVQRNFAGRSVLLTTHNMEEAETVCGTIGIITRGSMQCFGNVQHLKDRYSNGYRVMFEYGQEADIPACEAMLTNIIHCITSTPDDESETTTTTTTTSTTISRTTSSSPLVNIPVTCVDISGNRRTYAVPQLKHLSRLFSEIEREHENYHIVTYTVSQASLEDVFMTLVKTDANQCSLQPLP